jgi:hypothetical protein
MKISDPAICITAPTSEIQGQYGPIYKSGIPSFGLWNRFKKKSYLVFYVFVLLIIAPLVMLDLHIIFSTHNFVLDNGINNEHYDTIRYHSAVIRIHPVAVHHNFFFPTYALILKDRKITNSLHLITVEHSKLYANCMKIMRT